MKLYPHDHCPFCVRTERVATYSDVAPHEVYLPNDEAASGCVQTGARQVPKPRPIGGLHAYP